MRWQARLGARVVAYAVTVLLAVCGLVFLALAVYLWLAGVFEPPIAALLTAACSLLLAALVLLVVRRRGSAAPVPDRDELADRVEQALEQQVDPAVGAWIRRHPGRAAGVTLLLGIAAGYDRSVRRVIRDLLTGYAESGREERERRRD